MVGEVLDERKICDQGTFSNRALLGSGWADASRDRFELALVPWSVLVEREVTDSSVHMWSVRGTGTAVGPSAEAEPAPQPPLHEERNADARLEAEQRAQAMLNQLPEAILVADDTGRYIDANPAACEYLQLDYEHLVGARLLDLMPGHAGRAGYEVRAAAGPAVRPEEGPPQDRPEAPAGVPQ